MTGGTVEALPLWEDWPLAEQFRLLSTAPTILGPWTRDDTGNGDGIYWYTRHLPNGEDAVSACHDGRWMVDEAGDVLGLVLEAVGSTGKREQSAEGRAGSLLEAMQILDAAAVREGVGLLEGIPAEVLT